MMNKEEAIKILKEYAPRIKPFYEPQRTEYPQAIDMAIEALSANVVEVTDKSMESLIKGLEILGDTKDSADESEWIPCSERLPKEDAKYLVQMSYGIMRVLGWANILEKVDDYDFYNEKHGGWYELDSEWGYCEMNGVIAWMPLPKPYREDGEA